MDQLVLNKLKQEMQKLADETKVMVYNDYIVLEKELQHAVDMYVHNTYF